MKQILSIFITLAILWHTMSIAVVFVSFKINQDYIAKYLCINRDNPESDCHGCCQLKKELEKQQDNESRPQENEIKKVEIQYFTTSSQSSELVSRNSHQQLRLDFNTYTSLCIFDIFHPPKSCSS